MFNTFFKEHVHLQIIIKFKKNIYFYLIILFIYLIEYINIGYKWTPQEVIDLYML